MVKEIRALPLAEDIPISFNSVRKGPRSVDWRSDKPSEICWIETQVTPGFRLAAWRLTGPPLS